METFIGVVFILVCLLLIVVVLLQKGRGGGLGAAFGGAGSSAFGTRTGDVFTWITIVLTALFLLLAIGATFLYRPPTSKVLKPTLTPGKGPIFVTKLVRITCATANARIAYTTDGLEPIEDRAKQAGMVHASVEPGQTLKVKAFRKKWDDSDLVTVVYGGKVLAPTLSPEMGPISETTAVQITCDTPKAIIAYTTDGSDPVQAEAKPGTVSASVEPGQTLKARAFLDKWDPSELEEVLYGGKVLAPTLSPAAGPISKTTVVRITCRTANARIAYTTDGSEPIEDKAKPAGIVSASVEPGQTLKARAFFDKWDPSELVTVTYDKPATTKPATSPATSKPGAPAAGGDKNKGKSTGGG